MTDPPRYPEIGDGSSGRHDGGSRPRTVRWLYVLEIALAVAVLLLIVVLHLSGVVGPGSH